MEPFKNKLNAKAIDTIAKKVLECDSSFNQSRFIKRANDNLIKLELKGRVIQIATALEESLSKDFLKNLHTLTKCLSQDKDISSDQYLSDGVQGFLVWPLTYYIEVHGQENLHESLEALAEMTKRFTAEFAIRPFLQHHYHETFKILRSWKKSDDHHLRRLVSEGTRPRLPWGIKVEKINKNLSHNIQLIYSLRKDPSEYVRKSVANHLNDISYLDEKLFFDTIERMGQSPEEEWIKRHASRSLLKKGHPRALSFHGHNPKVKLNVQLKIGPKRLKEGDKLGLDLRIHNLQKSPIKALIEYCIYYLKKNGQYTKKPFRLRNTLIESELHIKKEIHFKKVTTRVHYPGKHFIDIQINGTSYEKTHFTLIQ